MWSGNNILKIPANIISKAYFSKKVQPALKKKKKTQHNIKWVNA